ncbi:MAG: NADH-quinone oxidoreductase subunit K [Nannocystaceae bacterium]
MSVPVTHFLYLGFGLFFVGLVGALLRRSPAVALVGIELMLAGAIVVLVLFSRAWGSLTGQLLALVAVVIAVAYAIVGGALVTDRSRRA